MRGRSDSINIKDRFIKFLNSDRNFDGVFADHSDNKDIIEELCSKDTKNEQKTINIDNKKNSNDKNESKKDENDIGLTKIDFTKNELYVFPFDVGQANFIVLRKKDNIVIIDAGISSKEEKTRIDPLLNKVFLDIQGKLRVDAIFITHPHSDHYNLFSSLLDEHGKCFKTTKCFLPGEENDWKSFKKQISGKKISEEIVFNYLGQEYEDIENNFLNDVKFLIFGVMAPLKKTNANANQLSLTIQVKYNTKRILFLGDSEGDVIDRLKGSPLDLRNLYLFFPDKTNKKISTLYNNIISIINNKEINKKKCRECFDNYWKLYNEITSEEINGVKVDFLELDLGKYIDNKELFDECKEKSNKAYDIDKKVLNECKKKSNKADDIQIKIDASKCVKNLGEYCSTNNILDGKVFFTSLNKCCGKTNHNNEEYWETWSKEMSPFNLLKKYIVRNIMYNYISITKKMIKFELSQLIFLPHHGTNTNYSQRLLGYFNGIDRNKAYIVSSSSFGKDGLPKRSTLEMCPNYPIHPEHPFIYKQDNDLNQKEKGERKEKESSMKNITKPIYVTGAAIAGGYCIKLSDRYEDKSIYMLYMYGKSCKPYWFDMLTDFKLEDHLDY